MTRIALLFASIAIALSGINAASATYTAASCNASDINAAYASEQASAADGDVIQIPAGTCVWSATDTVKISPSNSLTLTGAGPSTVIEDDNNASTSLFRITIAAGKTVRVSSLDLEPYAASVSVSYPISITGAASGTPSQVRIDHITGTWSPTTQISVGDDELFYFEDVFGVIDHLNMTIHHGGVMEDRMDDLFASGCSDDDGYGDCGWYSPDTYGTSQAMYLESSTITNPDANDAPLTDCDGGACRIVVRYNTITNATVENHGTESPGRRRGGRQQEVYNNTFIVTNGEALAGITDQRSGTALIFNNSVTVSGSGGISTYDDMGTMRRTNSLADWWTCDGTGPWDQNDGQGTADTGHIVALAAAGSITAVGLPGWGVHEFENGTGACGPGACTYVFVDLSRPSANGAVCSILDNTAATLTVGAGCGAVATGDSFAITKSTSYAHGTFNGASGAKSLTDTTQIGWSPGQWYNPTSDYSVVNLTRGWGSYVCSGGTAAECSGAYTTATTVPVTPSQGFGQPNTWNYGDVYSVSRAQYCIDQAGHGKGNLLTGYLPPVGAPDNALDPVYLWNVTGPVPAIAIVSPFPGTQQANVDYYAESSVTQGANTSPGSPFDGSSGTGWGTLANRPPTCTPYVAYWASDANSGNGELYVCTATNIWTAFYTPYPYPHPLTTTTTPGESPPGPPSEMSVSGIH